MTAYRMVPSTIARPVREVVQILDYYPKTLCPASVATSGVLACYRYQHPIPTPPPYLSRPNLLSKVTSQADSINVSECRGFFLLFHSDFIFDYFKSLWYEVADEMSTRIEVEMEINFEKKLIAVVKCFAYNIIHNCVAKSRNYRKTWVFPCQSQELRVLTSGN